MRQKRIAKKVRFTCNRRFRRRVKSFSEAKSICKNIGYPILIKAAGGGGGKGMKIVEEEEKLENLFLTAKTEAKKFLEMMNYILKNILKIQGILKFR